MMSAVYLLVFMANWSSCHESHQVGIGCYGGIGHDDQWCCMDCEEITWVWIVLVMT